MNDSKSASGLEFLAWSASFTNDLVNVCDFLRAISMQLETSRFTTDFDGVDSQQKKFRSLDSLLNQVRGGWYGSLLVVGRNSDASLTWHSKLHRFSVREVEERDFPKLCHEFSVTFGANLFSLDLHDTFLDLTMKFSADFASLIELGTLHPYAGVAPLYSGIPELGNVAFISSRMLPEGQKFTGKGATKLDKGWLLVQRDDSAQSSSESSIHLRQQIPLEKLVPPGNETRKQTPGSSIGFWNFAKFLYEASKESRKRDVVRIHLPPPSITIDGPSRSAGWL